MQHVSIILPLYKLELAYYLMGRPEAGQMMTVAAPTGVDAQTTITFQYASGALASLSCSFDQRLRNRALIAGTDGTFELDAPIFAPERLRLTSSPRPKPGPAPVQAGGRLDRLSQTIPALVRLRRRYAPLLRQIVRWEQSVRSYPYSGYGYQFEAAEVARCVRAGLRESPVIPLAETVEIMECLDLLRSKGRFNSAA